MKHEKELLVTSRPQQGRAGQAHETISLTSGPGDEASDEGSHEQRVADDATASHLLASGLELGLEQGHYVTKGGEQLDHGGQHLIQGNKGDIHRGYIYLLWQTLQVTRIHSFQDHYPVVLAQAVMELAVPHINGVDPGSPMLEQTIGESASGGTEISGHQAPHVQAKHPESVL
jgi:hypothetical protein